MRAGMLMAALLTVGLAPGAWAQGRQSGPEAVQEQPEQRLERQTRTPATTTAERLQSYAATLQIVEAKLRQAKESAEGTPAQSQQGAISPSHTDLLKAIREAWHGMQAVPPELFDKEVYKQAERRMQRDAGVARPTWQPSQGEAVVAAEDALQTLAGLRQQVSQMASQAGASAPIPPATAGGGTAR